MLRVKKAGYLSNGLKKIPGVELPYIAPGAKSVWQMYVIKVPEGMRDKLVLELRKKGIGASVHFDPPVHLQSYYSKNFKKVRLPITEKLSKSVITLPLFPGLTKAELNYVIEQVKSVLG